MDQQIVLHKLGWTAGQKPCIIQGTNHVILSLGCCSLPHFKISFVSFIDEIHLVCTCLLYMRLCHRQSSDNEEKMNNFKYSSIKKWNIKEKALSWIWETLSKLRSCCKNKFNYLETSTGKILLILSFRLLAFLPCLDQRQFLFGLDLCQSNIYTCNSKKLLIVIRKVVL